MTPKKKITFLGASFNDQRLQGIYVNWFSNKSAIKLRPINKSCRPDDTCFLLASVWQKIKSTSHLIQILSRNTRNYFWQSDFNVLETKLDAAMW